MASMRTAKNAAVPLTLHFAALASMGVGFVPRYTVLRELENGQLTELFPDTEVLNDQINIYLKKRNFEKPPFPDLIRHIQSLRLH